MADVALVVLDTLRKDAFDEHFGWLPGTRFENAFSTSHWTGPVHASLFTGLYPGEAGTYAHNRTLEYPDDVLAETLRDAGYTTRMYSSNVIVSPEFGFDRGFEQFRGSWNVERALTDGAVYDWHTRLRDSPDLESYLRGVRGSIRGDCDTLASLRRGLELGLGSRALDYGGRTAVETVQAFDFGDREFCYVNLMDAHAPYFPPPSYRTVDDFEKPEHPLYAVTGGATFDADRIRRAYDDCVRYLADVYAEVFAELESAFDYVVTVGDHGELFGEYGFYEHSYGVYPEAVRVPLVITGDGIDPDRHREETVSLLDVHRTILELADADAAGDAPGRGQCLLDGVESREYLTEYRGVPHPRQLRSLRERGVPEDRIAAYHAPLFGLCLPDGAYGYQVRSDLPAGRTDGCDGDRPIAFRLRGRPSGRDPERRLTDHVASLDVRGSPGGGLDLSAGVLDQLEDLGYA